MGKIARSLCIHSEWELEENPGYSQEAWDAD